VYDFGGFHRRYYTMRYPTLIGIGRRLQRLREEGIMVIGSGLMTHALPSLTRETMERGEIPGWSSDFDAWAADAVVGGAVDELSDYTRAPGMPYAHPTPDHFTPLFITLGASGQPDRPVKTAFDGYVVGLAKRSFQTLPRGLKYSTRPAQAIDSARRGLSPDSAERSRVFALTGTASAVTRPADGGGLDVISSDVAARTPVSAARKKSNLRSVFEHRRIVDLLELSHGEWR
jgi:Catalytic LigB subunit of aromatic ring-opening dioxygenase